MKSINQLLRLLHINLILARNGLDNWLVSIRLFSPFRFIVYFNPWNWARKNKFTRGEALRKSLVELGPIFVKFGQALSTRPDILPDDIAQELCKLQDKVPPFSGSLVLEILTAAFGSSPFEVFAQFDLVPLASASIAQVHAATLKTGEEVVVKILRPNMRKIIEKDLSILRTIANFAERYWEDSKRFKPQEVVSEFEYSLFNELDLRCEAANAGQLKRNFQGSSLLYVPEIFWDYTRENVMVMERIYGISISDIASLQEHGVNIKRLAERGVEIFFTQILRHSFFHADMHPGNIFVSLFTPQEPQYICIDFGIMGTLNDSDKRYLAENLYAFFNRDYYRVAQLHVESGWVARNTRIDEFENAIRTVCEPIFEKPLKDISFAQVVLRLFQVARRFEMEVQPQLILLQKTLLAIEGLGRQLYPDLDLSRCAKPYVEAWLKEQLSFSMLIKRARDNVPFFIEQLPQIPRLVYDVLSLSKEQKIRALEDQQKKKKSRFSKRNEYSSLWLGIFVSMVPVSVLSYFELLNKSKLIIGAGIVAVVSGFAVLISTKSSRKERDN